MFFVNCPNQDWKKFQRLCLVDVYLNHVDKDPTPSITTLKLVTLQPWSAICKVEAIQSEYIEAPMFWCHIGDTSIGIYLMEMEGKRNHVVLLLNVHKYKCKIATNYNWAYGLLLNKNSFIESNWQVKEDSNTF